jgi:hypothetical protein
MSKSNVASLVDFIDPSKSNPKTFLKVYGYGYKAISRYHLSFNKLSAFARMRDRLFTFFLMQDLQESKSLNQAMGRKSLKFVDAARFRGFQMGGFFKESPSNYKYRSLVSIRELEDEIFSIIAKLNSYLDSMDLQSDQLLVGIGIPKDLRDPFIYERYEPFYG